jgi:tetratricopeptide (TPR) repeat protein
MALEEMGRSEEALEELRRSFALSNDPRIQLNIGQLLADMGRFDEAAVVLAQVPRGIPQRGVAQRDLAVILLNQLKRRDEGLAALREAIELETDPEQARLMREELDRMSRGR